jgi:uncharacterized protein
MDVSTLAPALIGGILIGLASVGLLLFNGRIAGISGILGGLLTPPGEGETPWRIAFVGGLLAGGLLLLFAMPGAFPEAMPRSVPVVAAAGLLVGFGTRLGTGCTSGHGVCGISRLSGRSIVATVTFMATGIGTVLISRLVAGGAA